MRRLVVTLSVLAILGTISPGLPILAQPTQTPHENPATATGSLDTVTLLLSYSKIISLATSRQYQDAQDLLNELEHADIPDELRYIIDQYSNLCQQLFTTLDNLEALLDEASALLSHNQTHQAKQRLDSAEAVIQDALFLQADIEAATTTLGDRLGVFASRASNQLRESNARLEESLERLRQLIDELNQLWQRHTESYVQKAGLIATELSLDIMPSSAFVGDSITASGKLSGGGKPLAGREITLNLGDKPVTATTTEIDGSYATRITVPYNYVAKMTFTAVYEPPGDDSGKYLASRSPSVRINTSFYQTRLEVSAPKTVHPGLPFTVSGRVSSTDGDTDRTVKVLFDDTQLAEATVTGQFSLEATPPVQVSTDNHTLTVAVTPKGRYSGATDTRSINFSSLPIYIETQTPPLVLLPRDPRISGRVYHELGPVPNARVSLDFKDSSATATTSPDGTFAASLETPLDLSLASPEELTITVAPVEPWYSALRMKRQLFTINALSAGLVLVILIALGLLIYRTSKSRLSEEKGVPPIEVIELPAITPAPRPKAKHKHKLTGIKGRILSAYRGALEAIEMVSGTGMAPNITLREFLKMATLLPPTATRLFAELTVITESALYSAHSPHGDTAARAESLATDIKEELRRGTP